MDKLVPLPLLSPAPRAELPQPHTADAAGERMRLPPWLRVNLAAGEAKLQFNATRAAVAGNELHTVCEEARCPNIQDCWGSGTATFMVAGKECTRGCKFCAVETLKAPELPEDDEPEHLANAVERMGLAHVVVTVVNRDDLADGGAAHYRRCIDAVHQRTPHVTLELLCSDLGGNLDALGRLLQDIPLAVFAHNVECVPRLDREVRDPRASFAQSLRILKTARQIRPDVWTKSSLMIGVGETDDEVTEALGLLRAVGVDLVTLGQYIAPGRTGTRYLPVARYATPEQFTVWEAEARAMGFLGVASGPMVRSSYRAEQLLADARRYSPSGRGPACVEPSRDG